MAEAPAPRPHRIVLVDRERDHLFAPSLLWLMVGQRDAASIRRPLKRLARKGIDVRMGEVERIDPAARRVTLAGGETLDADYLVVSLGVELHPSAIPGLAGAGHNFYTLPGAEAFRDALHTLRAGRIVVMTATPAYKCPAAPYEAAMLVDAFCRKHGRRSAVQIDVYAAEPAPILEEPRYAIDHEVPADVRFVRRNATVASFSAVRSRLTA